METSKIIEGNKLIAEFMGIKINHLGKGNLFKDPETYLPCTEKELDYNSSWDWIMPVVKKIIPPHGWQLSGVQYQTSVINALMLADIEKVWFAVVEFIKWYNSNK